MVDKYICLKLAHAFPDSFINGGLEFIAHARSNTYFRLDDCYTELDVKCKVLELLSRSAHKAQPYHTNAANRKFHEFMLHGINDFLGTRFSEQDMALIYQRLGDRVRHGLTIQFVESGYNMELLEVSVDG